MLQIASFVVGVFYGTIAKTFRRYVLLPGLALLAAGFLVTALAPVMPLVFVGSALFGVGAGIQYVTTLYNTSKAVEQSVVSMALSLVLAVTSLGFSVSPLVIEGVKELLFGPGAGADLSMVVAGAGCAVLFVVDFVRCRFFAKQDRLDDVAFDDELLV